MLQELEPIAATLNGKASVTRDVIYRALRIIKEKNVDREEQIAELVGEHCEADDLHKILCDLDSYGI